MVINAIGFNLVWFGLVMWGNIFIPIALIALMVHLIWISKVKNEWILLLSITFIGLIVDSFLQNGSVYIFTNEHHLPWWLIILWTCFAATICHSMNFLSGSYLFQMLAGLVAPLSYIAGAEFDAVRFGLPLTETYFLVAFIWSGLFILFFKLKKWIVKE